MDINPNAPIVVALDATINAPADRVWQLHTQIANWPDWNPGINRVEFDDRLDVGNQFTWETSGMTITSTISEIQPRRRIVWGGDAHGIYGVHAWTFTTVGDHTVVRTEESWEGEPVLADTANLHDALRQSLELWLAALTTEAERG